MAVTADGAWRRLADVDGEGAARSGRTSPGFGERLLTPLERALRELIRAEGPISVEAFMEACNSYYYGARDPLGAAGDFVTAPEVSQMFGEIVGAALADCWSRAGSPSEAIYAELGPGRGTLASDALRVLRRAGFEGAAHLVETSPVLIAAQSLHIPHARWHDSLEGLPESPLLLVANEFFDALPIRQFVGGVERRVTVAAGGLAFDRGGVITEESPARASAAGVLSRHLCEHGGVALVIDYGHERRMAGDTLQAVRKHGFAPVLAIPGEQDLTAHVDFEALTKPARDAGASVTRLVTQGEWLDRLGIRARAQSLARAHPQRAAEIDGALRRLTDEGEMGRLFKVIAIHSPDWPRPAGFE